MAFTPVSAGHAKVVLPSAQPMYEAAARWRDEALIGDHSLFSAKPLDGRAAAHELVRDFIGQPDEGKGDFLSKLRAQLASTSVDGVQAAAELLYVHCLVVATESLKSKTKAALVNDVADIRDSGTAHVPEDLVPALRGGVARPGQAYGSYRYKMFAYLIRVFGAVKALPTAERSDVLRDFGRFQELLSGIDDQSVWSQRYALEHLLFPEVSPAVLSRDDRQEIVTAFASEIGGDLSLTVRDVVARLEPNVEYGDRRGVNLYRTPYRERWHGSKATLKDYAAWSRKVIASVDLEVEERGYKIDRAPLIKEALRSAQEAQNPCPALRRALVGYNVVDYRVSDTFLRWAEENSTDAGAALRELAEEPGPESIDRFLAKVPKEAAPGIGARLSIASALLMALAPAELPPWRETAADITRRLADSYKPQEGATPGEVYVLFLERLDAILSVVNAEDSVLRDRLDAQGLAWAIANYPVEKFPEWTDEERVAFAGWRSGKPVVIVEEDPTTAVVETESGSVSVPTSLESLATSLYMDSTDWLEESLTLLKHKRQLILQGPPGTGKTYIGLALARYVAGDPKRVTTVQFHPGTSYEDFVQGLRPDPKQPTQFKVVDGPLMRISKAAADDPENVYVLLIDEINRGNVPAAFGELYFLLEYRAEAITLMYGERHSLPANLVIIGTMNTADRSITALDSALRRRFYIRDLDPQTDPLQGILRAFLEDKDQSLLWLADLLDLANKQLDDRDLAIGPSHFMGKNVNEEWAKRAWDNSVMPTLREYFHSNPARLPTFEFGSLKIEVKDIDVDDSAAD
jgi:5-methylcytosine-specific restriction protein B